MHREAEIIYQITAILPRSQSQLNRVFEADAEIIQFAGQRLLFNTDDFSDEDLLRDTDPYTLGWNLAVGGLTDILATGGSPLYFAHSLVVGKTWSKEYIRQFTRGIAAVLKAAQVNFIGGDLGFSERWRYTATAIGVLDGQPLLRSNAKVGDQIYLTGRMGTGNLEAYLKLFSDQKGWGGLVRPLKNQFRLRVTEAGLIRKYANACIDTSDGVFNALNTIAELSGVGFEVSGLPYIKAGRLLAQVFALPELLLFLGECGEYELLFTIDATAEAAFLNEAQQADLVFFKIGQVTQPGKKIVVAKDRKINLNSFHFRARDYDNIRQYIEDMIAFIKRSSNG
ncbi:MAG: thiamine-phosphate kinase [Bacillota bacterium]|jgi:thiamine-monophosphate kinase